MHAEMIHMFTVLLQMFFYILYMLTMHFDLPQLCVCLDVTYPFSGNTHARWDLTHVHLCFTAYIGVLQSHSDVTHAYSDHTC